MQKKFVSRQRLAAGGVGLLAVVLIFLTGCQTGKKDLAGANDPPFDVDKLYVGETVRISFQGPKEWEDKPIEQRIKTDGTINLPLIEPLKVAHLKLAEAQQLIHDAYVPRFLTRLNVVIQHQDRYFYVEGHVKSSGKFVHEPETTVLKAISAAGGFDDYAQKKKVKLIRSSGKVLKVNCVAALDHPELDVPVYPNDKIQVPMRWW